MVRALHRMTPGRCDAWMCGLRVSFLAVVGACAACTGPKGSAAAGSAPGAVTPPVVEVAQAAQVAPTAPAGAAAASPEARRRVKDCVLPASRGIPRQLGPFSLGEPATQAKLEDEALPDLCVRGFLVAESSFFGEAPHTNRYLLAGELCNLGHSPACDDPKAYADALAAAWGVAYRHDTNPDRYHFITDKTEAFVEVDPAGEYLTVRIVDIDGDTICTTRDGFSEFHREFMAAVAAGDRERVADHFRFPFDDEWRQGTLKVQTRAEFRSRYGEYIAPGASSDYPTGRPTQRVECRFAWQGYLDLGWQEAGMLAQKRAGKWAWTRRAYVP